MHFYYDSGLNTKRAADIQKLRKQSQYQNLSGFLANGGPTFDLKATFDRIVYYGLGLDTWPNT